VKFTSCAEALATFRGASTISSSSRFVVEGVCRESGVVHPLKVNYPILFVFGILYRGADKSLD
jgi:hypothetical protein